MNIKEKHFKIREDIVVELFESLTDNAQFLLFLYGNRKICTFNFDKKKEALLFFKLAMPFYKEIDKKIKCKLIIFETKKGEKKFELIFYRGKINVKKFNPLSKYEAQLYGIPKCCYKKYVEEENNLKDEPQSLSQTIRFIKQCYNQNIMDNEFVKIFGKVACRYGFVPCHPQCKEALKIKEQYDKIVENYKNET